jgi:CBS domain-containing protein
MPPVHVTLAAGAFTEKQKHDLAKLGDGEAGRALVAEDGEVVGIITSSDLTRWLRRWRALDSRERDDGERDRRAHQPDKRNLDRW